MAVRIFILFLILFLNFMASAADSELPEKGREVVVNCLEFPDVSYKIFIPEEYDPSKPCAIVYTFSPGGGGMVGAHKHVNEVTPAIIVGITGTKNGRPEMEYMGDLYAIMWDTLARFNIDPAAQYAGGFSGGAVLSYNLARQYKERISGVLASGGWLQLMYDPWFVYPKGLLVARTTGSADKNANSFAGKDGDHLRKAGCVVKDWSQPGGHSVANPESMKTMMQWLIYQKAKDEFPYSEGYASRWDKNPYSPTTVKDMLNQIKLFPHTKICNLALLKLFAMMKDDRSFCKITIPASFRSEAFAGFFGYTAYGAAFAKDTERFNSAVYALDKLCPDQNSKWGGIVAALYLFSGEGVADSKKALDFIKKYSKAKRVNPYNQLVLVAAFLKNGMKPQAQAAAKKSGRYAGTDKRLSAVQENLDKALRDGPDALDPKTWFQGFGEGD